MLNVFSDYYSHENLASYHVDTPDPLLHCPQIGQRIVVRWNIPTAKCGLDDLHIELTVRFQDREEDTVYIPVKKPCGIHEYLLLNEEYFEKGCIKTYRVRLLSGECLLEEWRHLLWVDLIRLDD